MKQISLDMALRLTQEILQRKLTPIQVAVLRGVWLGLSYQDIIGTAVENGNFYSLGHLKNTASELWQALSDAIGGRVSKTNFAMVLQRYVEHHLPQFRQDLEATANLSGFCGRLAELDQLSRAVQLYRAVVLVGMSGVGKTTLVTKWLAVQMATQKSAAPAQQECQGAIWRSLRDAPPVDEMLHLLWRFVSPDSDDCSPVTTEQAISRLLAALRQQRYLIVLDDWESVLTTEKLAGHCAPEHEGYGRLLKRLAEEQHQSCLILISREQPVELPLLESACLFRLKGLKQAEAEMLLAPQFASHQPGLAELIQIHRGNPAALKLAAATIRELFDGSIAAFLAQTSLVVGDVLTSRLDQQFERLTETEKAVLYWLAMGKTVGLNQLKTLATSLSRSQMLSVLESLRRRCLIEKTTRSETSNEKRTTNETELYFTLEPVVNKYVIEQMIEQICEEIQRLIQAKPWPQQLNLLDSPNLFLAPTKQAQKIGRRIQAKLGRPLQTLLQQIQLQQIQPEQIQAEQIQPEQIQADGVNLRFVERNLLKLRELLEYNI